jgi:nucleoside-diphosphate-sugar epimerase
LILLTGASGYIGGRLLRTLHEKGEPVRAIAPHGLAGLAYWYALYPAHRLIFKGMLHGIADSLRPRTPSIEEGK